MENPWVSIFATTSERVVHAKVVPSSHAEEITFEHKRNIVEMTRRGEWEVVEEGGEVRVKRILCPS